MNEESKGWGGKRAGAGRKKGGRNASHKENKSSGRIVLSCLESEAAEIRALAEQAGKSVSRYVVDIVLKRN